MMDAEPDVEPEAEPSTGFKRIILPRAPEVQDQEPQIDHYAEMGDFDDYGSDASEIDTADTMSEPAAPRMAKPHLPIPLPEAKKVVQQPIRKPILPSKRAQAEAQPGGLKL